MKTKIEANNPIMEWALVFILSMAKGFTPFSTKISTTPAKLESSIVHSCNNLSITTFSFLDMDFLVSKQYKINHEITFNFIVCNRWF